MAKVICERTLTIFLEVEMAQFLKIAELSANDVEKIRNLERSLGTQIMAFQPGLDTADLTDEQVQAVKVVEKQLGVILLAFSD